MSTTSMRRSAVPTPYDVADDDALYETRMPSSARRYRTHDTMDDPAIQPAGAAASVQRRASRAPGGLRMQGMVSKAVSTETPRTTILGKMTKRNPIAVLVVGGVVAVLLVLLLTMLTSWWQGYQDNMTYGYPRTSQLDAVVGHDDSASHMTHFIFINLHCKVQIIEIAGGDPAHTKIFNGPTLYGQGCDMVPVKGEILPDGDHVNLVVHIQDQQILFLNDGKTFHMR